MANFTVTKSTDDGSMGTLSWAIIQANTQTGEDTITFDASLSGQTITLAGSGLTITDALTINGLGADQLTISGDNTSRIFYIDDGLSADINVTLDGLTLTGGRTTGVDDDGAAIWNRENLTITNSILSGNNAFDDGGAIRNDGTLLVSNTTFANNTSTGTSDTSGGGAILNSIGANATIENSTFSGNHASNGGAIRNDGNLTVRNSTLSGNTANLGVGGGLVNTVGNATIENSTITNNTAAYAGGGVYNFEGTIPAGYPMAGTTVTTTSFVRDSIIANNTDNDDLGGTAFTSNGNNLIGNGDGAAGFINGVKGDIVGTAASPIDVIIGTSGKEALPGTALDDLIYGLDGDDTLKGLDGDDTLYGGDGNDALKGGLGTDTLYGEDGNDTLSTQEAGTLIGGTGDDTYNVYATGVTIVEKASEGTDTVFTTVSNLTLADNVENLILAAPNANKGLRQGPKKANGNALDNRIIGNRQNNSVQAGNGNDSVWGSYGNDVLKGQNGNDRLFGEVDDDKLIGGAGNDYLVGGSGNDTLTGGKDQDTFVFSASSFGALGIDVITDWAFKGTTDIIQLDSAIFSAITFEIVATDAAAETGTGTIVYSTGTGNLFYNTDGATAGFGGGGQFATLNGAPTLSSADFTLV